MKVLIFGKNGQVGWELNRSCSVLGDIRVAGSDTVNFQKPDTIANVIREFRPTHIVNAAAYTAVDKAESEETLANQVNGHSVGVIAEEAKKINAHVVHYSTDYVFDGTKSDEYVETDFVNPLNAYGRSKLLGEKYISQVGGSHTVLRISWIYGQRGSNFYKTMCRLGSEREVLSIVSDQIGSPSWSRNIADATSLIIRDPHLADKSGIYHLSSSGSTSWYGFAKKIFEIQGAQPGSQLKVQEVKKILAVDYKTPATRPSNSCLSNRKVQETFSVFMPSWENALDLVVRGEH